MSSQFSYSAERISDLIGMIYDCVLAPDKWTSVIDAIRLEFNFHNATLAINSADGEVIFGAIAGVEPYWKSLMPTFGTAVLDLLGGPKRLLNYPLEEPIIQSRAMPDYDLKQPLLCGMGTATRPFRRRGHLA
jgi:hypothetical protein